MHRLSLNTRWGVSFLLFVGLFLMLTQCTERTARKMTASMSQYIYAYTSGTISRTAPIRVRFTSSLAGVDEIRKQIPAGILTFKPAIKGNAIWEDDRTIRFEPAEDLPSNTQFVGQVLLKQLFKNAPNDAEIFEFDFHSREMYLTVDIEGLQSAALNDLSRQDVVGSVRVSDVANATKLEECLTATQNGQALKIEWSHDQDPTRHFFVVHGVVRGEQASQVKFNWTGIPIGSRDGKGEQVLEIPPLGVFKAMSARIEQDNDQFVVIRFSDPLQPNQNLAGLVTLTDHYGDIRYVIDGNVVRLYPSYRISGDKKVNVLDGVKNIKGTKADVSSWDLTFADLKPAVRLAGRGVIMPNSEGLYFPFEAVNLNYVEVEILKIYQNNILQFLQTNELEDNNELERVGRIVLRSRVTLRDLNPNASTQQWTRYALDLGKMIAADPTAVYQVRIGFRPEYSNYQCGGAQKDKEALTPLPAVQAEGEEIESFWTYYGMADEDNYEWNRREDPCALEYYNYENFVRRNVFASPLGIIAKRGNDGSMMVAISDLKSTDHLSGVTVEFFDAQQQLISSTKTNGDGIARAELKRKAAVVVATSGKNKGYLTLNDGRSLSLSSFEVDGVSPQKGVKGYLYGERGVWRPGDSLYLNFVLEDKSGKGPENPPVTMELYDPRGSLQYKLTSVDNVGGIYPFRLATRADAPTGSWRAHISAGGAEFDERLRIETVKPNRLKVNLDAGKKLLQSSDTDFKASLDVAWLHGAPASNVRARIEAQFVADKTTFEKYPNFVFDDPGRSLNAEPQVVYEGNVDASGHANVSGKLLVNNQSPGKLKVNFRLRAFEPGGDVSSDFFSLPYSPYPAYAGVNVPTLRSGEKRVDIDKESVVTVASVGEDGRALPNRQLVANLYKVEWRWWWDDNDGQGANFNSGKNLTAIQTTPLTTGADGRTTFKVKVSEWGRYYVRINDAVSGHSTGDFFYAGYPWNEDGNEDQSRDAAARFSFSSNKGSYKVGETVELNIPSAQNGKALVSLENGRGVVATYWLNAKAGENNFKFKATPEMSPTIYAHISFVQPHGQALNDRPMRLYGAIPITVEDPKAKLAPVVKVADVVKPEETFTVSVNEQSGKAMAYTLAVVDDGLLDLTRFTTPNPYDAFYAKEALGVTTWDVYDQVLGAYGGKLESILSIGGDKAKSAKNAVRANRFEPVVRHIGPFYLAAGSTAKHNIKMPNYIGSVRVMAVAAYKGAYGCAEKTVSVRKPLMILATLPRVLGPGESLNIPVNVFAMESKVKDVNVQVSESSGLVQMGANTQRNLTFAKPGEQMASFALTTPQKPGIAKFKIKATGGGETATQDIEIEIRNPNPVQSRSTGGIADKGAAWTGKYDPVGMAGTNKATLEISTLPPINLGERLRYLIQYPHGCIEQTTSAAFPQLYVGQLTPLDPATQKQTTENVKAALAAIQKFQTPAGGFGYWPGDPTPSSWGSTYAGHFILEAKAKGYSLPSGILDRWVVYQKKMAQRWDPNFDMADMFDEGSSELNQAYRLYTLALAGQAELSAMNRLRERTKLSGTAKWRLAAAYAAAGKPEVAKQLIKGNSATVAPYRQMGATYGSEVRDMAMIAETQLLVGDRNGAFELLKSVAEHLSSPEWLSTQDVAYSLLAYGKLAGKTTAQKVACSYVIGGKTQTAFVDKMLSVALNGDQATQISVSNQGAATLFVRVVAAGQPAAGKEVSSSKNLGMTVRYTDLKGNPINVGTLTQGTDFIAEVTVSNNTGLALPARELALTQIVPSGWEILNPRMDRLAAFSNTSIPEYQDVRDDRVYTYFDLPAKASQTYRIQVNAAYPGRYYLPAVQCAAMYNNNVQSTLAGRWIEVIQPNNSKMVAARG